MPARRDQPGTPVPLAGRARGRRGGERTHAAGQHVPPARATACRPRTVVGRPEVFAAFERGFAVRESSHRIIVVEGDAGTGRSTVLREMRRRAAAAVASPPPPNSAARAPGAFERIRGVVGDIVDDAQPPRRRPARLAVRTPPGTRWPDRALRRRHSRTWRSSDRDARPGPARPGYGTGSALQCWPSCTRPRADPATLLTLDDFDNAGGESMQVVHDVVTADTEGLLVVAAAPPGALAGRRSSTTPPRHACDRRARSRWSRAVRRRGARRRAEQVRALVPLIERRVGANPVDVLQFLQRAGALGAVRGPDEAVSGRGTTHCTRSTRRRPRKTSPPRRCVKSTTRSSSKSPRASGSRSRSPPFRDASDRSTVEVAETILNALDRGLRPAPGRSRTGGLFLAPHDEYVFVSERVEEAIRSQVAPRGAGRRAPRASVTPLLRSDSEDDVLAATRHLNAAFIALRRRPSAWISPPESAGRAARPPNRRVRTRARIRESGLACLPPDADDRDHLLVLDLHFLAAEMAWITGALATMHSFIDAARSLQTTCSTARNSRSSR